MVCPSCKKRRPSSKAPASKNICDYISNAKNKETLCFFVFLCFHKQTNQTLEVLSFMKWKQIIFVKEVVSFLKKLLVSWKHECSLHIYCHIYSSSHNLSYVIITKLKIEQKFDRNRINLLNIDIWRIQYMDWCFVLGIL